MYIFRWDYGRWVGFNNRMFALSEQHHEKYLHFLSLDIGKFGQLGTGISELLEKAALLAKR